MPADVNNTVKAWSSQFSHLGEIYEATVRAEAYVVVCDDGCKVIEDCRKCCGPLWLFRSSHSMVIFNTSLWPYISLNVGGIPMSKLLILFILSVCSIQLALAFHDYNKDNQCMDGSVRVVVGSSNVTAPGPSNEGSHNACKQNAVANYNGNGCTQGEPVSGFFPCPLPNGHDACLVYGSTTINCVCQICICCAGAPDPVPATLR